MTFFMFVRKEWEMKKIKIIMLIKILLILITAPCSHVQSEDLDTVMVNQKVEDLVQQGNSERSVIAAQKAIEIAEENVGPDHPYVAISLNNLALLYSNEGEYAKAEPLYNRSLAIWEKTLGPDHPYVANCLNELSRLYHAMGKNKKASEVDKEIKRIRAIKE